jgi:mono/diheme cytochrome c family protein
MLKAISLIAAAAFVAAGAGYGAQTNEANQNVVIPVGKTAPVDGRAMYVNYCAPCHGVDGKGNGPVASALRQPPVDLTMLSHNNGGKFPATHITSVIGYGATVPAHGTQQMPVWGPIFGNMDQGSQLAKTMRINTLTSYLKTIQAQ